MSKRLIAVYDETTGIIKQMVMCTGRDAGHQHVGIDGHLSVDVTGHPEAVKADSHIIDIETRQVSTRVATLEETRTAALRAAGLQFEMDVRQSMLDAAMAAQNDKLVAAQDAIMAAPDMAGISTALRGAAK